MRKLPTLFARSRYLQDRGFSAQTAALIAQDQGFLQSLLSTYFVREVVLDYDSQAENFSVDVSYCSRINPTTGSADESTTLTAPGNPLDPNSPNFNPAFLI